MPQTNLFDPLPGLRDIHLPEPVAWWPPAPGWWIGVALALIGLYIAITEWRKYLRSPARAARRELAAITSTFAADHNTRETLIALSQLLRRAALTRFPAHEVAALTGDDWLRFLDTSGGTDQFSTGPGQTLAHGPYQPRVVANIESLLSLTKQWLAAALPRRSSLR